MTTGCVLGFYQIRPINLFKCAQVPIGYRTDMSSPKAITLQLFVQGLKKFR